MDQIRRCFLLLIFFPTFKVVAGYLQVASGQKNILMNAEYYSFKLNIKQYVPSPTWSRNNMILLYLIMILIMGGVLILVLQAAESRPLKLKMKEMTKYDEHISCIYRLQRYFDPKSELPI